MSYDPAESHDQNFKMLLAENPREAITFALPHRSRYLRRDAEIQPIREETIKTFFSDSFLRMDVPILVKDKNGKLVFLLEHHHDPYSFSIHKLARYMLYLQDQYECRVIPVVFFPHAASKNKAIVRELESGLGDKQYLQFTYEAVFLKELRAKEYLTSRNLVARMLLPFMRYPSHAWLEVLDSSIEAVLEFTPRARRAKYLDFVLHYFNLKIEQWEAYQNYKRKHKPSEAPDMINVLLKEKGWEEGFVKGKDEGKAEGKAEGESFGKISESRNLLLMLLPKKLGQMPHKIEQALHGQTDLNRMHTILASLLELQSWQEVEQLLNGKS